MWCGAMQHQFQSFGPAVIAARVDGSRERAPAGELREACMFLQLGGHVIPRHRVSSSASPMTGSGGDPVRRGLSIQSLRSLGYLIPAFRLRSLSYGGQVAGMTTGCDFAFSQRIAPEVCKSVGPREYRGRSEDRVRAAPAVSCAFAHRKRAHEHTGTGGASRPSLRNGLRLTS